MNQTTFSLGEVPGGAANTGPCVCSSYTVGDETIAPVNTSRERSMLLSSSFVSMSFVLFIHDFNCQLHAHDFHQTLPKLYTHNCKNSVGELRVDHGHEN